MRHHGPATDEPRKTGSGFGHARRIHQHRVVDAGELGDLEGESASRPDEGAPPIDYLRSARDHRSDLYNLIGCGVEPGGLHVDERDFVLEPEHGRARTLRERRVCCGNVGIRSRLEERGQRFSGHAWKRSTWVRLPHRTHMVGRGSPTNDDGALEGAPSFADPVCCRICRLVAHTRERP